jgi:hypothetical protein
MDGKQVGIDGPTRHMQVGVKWADTSVQVGSVPPTDHWTPNTRSHPSLTYWLKHSVQKEIL